MISVTLRLKNDRYIDIELYPQERMLKFISPIPDISEKDLYTLSDKFSYKFLLPITGEAIIPDNPKVDSHYEFKNNKTLLHYLLALADNIITDI